MKDRRRRRSCVNMPIRNDVRTENGVPYGVIHKLPLSLHVLVWTYSTGEVAVVAGFHLIVNCMSPFAVVSM